MQFGFFDVGNKEDRLSVLGDNLEKLNRAIDWEIFRPILDEAFKKEHKGVGGRPSFDYVMMFKILIIQRYYNLSDDQTEYQINDRLSFMRFLGLGLSDKVPDAKTIWNFKNVLSEKHLAEKLFKRFDLFLREAHIVSHKGSIVDATFSEVPRQHNTPDEKKELNEGKTPEEWQKNPHKLAQKDVDARYTKKRDEYHFGYKNHIKIDSESKLITASTVTPANCPDFKVFSELIEEEDKEIWADSGYNVKPVHESLPKDTKAHILERNTRGHFLTQEQKESNTRKSKVRVRVEHVFGYMKNTMKGITQRSIGQIRATFNLTLTNLTYNFCRYEFLTR